MKSRLHMAPDFQTPPTARGWFCLHWDPINSWWIRSCSGTSQDLPARTELEAQATHLFPLMATRVYRLR